MSEFVKERKKKRFLVSIRFIRKREEKKRFKQRLPPVT